jgi:serine/threonine protein kinase
MCGNPQGIFGPNITRRWYETKKTQNRDRDVNADENSNSDLRYRPGHAICSFPRDHPPDGPALVRHFGSSRFKSDDGTLAGESGTICYSAPELFTDGAELSASVDFSAFGLILFEIIGGFPVFFSVFLISVSPFEVIEQIGCWGRPPIPRLGIPAKSVNVWQR